VINYKEDCKMKSSWMQAALINFLILVLMAWHASARGRDVDPWCLTLGPYVDELQLDLTYIDRDPATVRFDLVWQAQLPGRPVSYRLPGGGTGLYNRAEGTWTLDLLVRNDTVYFGNHSMCKLSATLDADLNGPWTAECTGRNMIVYEFYTWGTVVPHACGEAPLSVVQSPQAVNQTSLLAGVK
jgi:hypothetical protein